MLESGNQKIQYGRQVAILKVTSLKINRLLPMATINMHMKFEIEIPKQPWLMLRKPCRLQTDGRTDGRTDGLTRWIQYTPLPTSLGGGIISSEWFIKQVIHWQDLPGFHYLWQMTPWHDDVMPWKRFHHYWASVISIATRPIKFTMHNYNIDSAHDAMPTPHTYSWLSARLW